MKKKLLFRFILLFIILILSGLVVWPKGPDLNLGKIGLPIKKELKLKKGLDLQGGTQLVYDLEIKGDVDKNEAQEKATVVIRNRIDAFGVSEPIIYSETFGNSTRVVVQLPGIQNIDEAVSLIGKTAQLEFKEQEPQAVDANQPIMIGGSWKEEPSLTGADLKRADVGRDETGSIQINLEFTQEGANKFAEVTGRNIGQPVAIFLDDQLLSAPNVQNEITGGKAVITGNFSLEEAKNLVIQLNAGALPVPMELVEQTKIGATLGDEAVTSSLLAAIVGFSAVVIFLLSFYRISGVLNVISWIFYTLITVTIFKLFSITLTLAGIAGFILSAGAAAEASVLVLERIREEIRRGKSVELAIDNGFKGAWPSIKDSNLVSLILAAIVFYFGTGLVKGFGVTLGIGVIVSLITIWIVDWPLLQLLARRKFIKNPKFLPLIFGLNDMKRNKSK
jgi:preprotein translocase subunit SecD